MKRLYLMITITNRVMGSKRFVDFYRAFGAPVVFTALGRGTASDEVLSYLGLEATEKSVMHHAPDQPRHRHCHVPAFEQHRRADGHELFDYRQPGGGAGCGSEGG